MAKPKLKTGKPTTNKSSATSKKGGSSFKSKNKSGKPGAKNKTFKKKAPMKIKDATKKFGEEVFLFTISKHFN